MAKKTTHEKVIIRLKHGYRGRPTREQFIAPGEYAIDDPALFGAGRYLINTERAVVVSGEVPAEAVPPVEVPPDDPVTPPEEEQAE